MKKPILFSIVVASSFLSQLGWSQTPVGQDTMARVAQAEQQKAEFNASALRLQRILQQMSRTSRFSTAEKNDYRVMAQCTGRMRLQGNRALNTYVRQVRVDSTRPVVVSSRSVVEEQLHCMASTERRKPAFRTQLIGLLYTNPEQQTAAAVQEALSMSEAYAQEPTVSAPEVATEPVTSQSPGPVLEQGPAFGTSAWIQANYAGTRPSADQAPLSAEQARQLFPNFDIQYVNGRATLRGRIYAACRSAFTVENSSQSSEGQALIGQSDSGDAVVGFRLVDRTGAGRRCMQFLAQGGQTSCEADEFDSENKPNPRFCVSLSSIEGASNISFGTVPAGRIGLIGARNPNSESARPVGYVIGDALHRPAAELAAEREENARRDRLTEIEVLSGIASSCRDTGADRDAAEDAIQRLGNYDAAEVSDVFPGFDRERLLLEISRSDLRTIKDRIAEADTSELATIREELLALLSDHPDFATDIRKLYEKIANRYVELGQENPDEAREAFASAREAMTELAGTGAYSRAEVARFREVRSELSSMELESAASEGYYSQRFWSMWRDQYRSNYSALMTSCYGARVGHFGMTAMFSSRSGRENQSMDACTGAVNRYQRTLSASQTAAQTTMEQNRMVAQMNNTFQMQSLQLQNSMLMGSMGTSNPTAGGAAYVGGTIGQMPSPTQIQMTMPLTTPLTQ